MFNQSISGSLILLIILVGWSLGAWSDDTALRDPTRPLGYSAGSGPVTEKRLQLQSILISSERKLAIINGQQLRENDVIKGTAGIRVARIEANDVTLRQGEKNWRLSLNATSVRQ